MTNSPTTADVDSTADLGEGNLHHELFAAYLAAGARVASWVIVSAVVFRWAVADYAMLGVVRYTIAILNYTSLGLAPAMIRLLAEARIAGPKAVGGAGAGARADSSKGLAHPGVLDYAQAGGLDARTVYSNALIVVALTTILGVIASIVFATHYSAFLHAPPGYFFKVSMGGVIWLMGMGTVLRLAGDAPGAWLQTHGQIGRDNVFLAIGEVAWVVLFIALGTMQRSFGIEVAATSYFAAAIVPLLLRWGSAAWLSGMLLPDLRTVRRNVLWVLLVAGGAILLAQVADYLYAPIDYVLINHYLDPVADAAAYTPMAQIGSALLLVSSGLAAVLLPRSAVAHAAGNISVVKRYYVRGTLLSGAALAIVAAGIWLTLPTLLRVWLGKVIPQTVDVMPIMLLASVVGGSGMVGRSILIGSGKFGVFTASVLLAAVGNVVISFLLVRYTGFGLAGVVLGTVAATVVRCVIWMPWYVHRMLRRQMAAAPV
jgi:O-antigen/teichoic acid export membrane protein